MNRYSFNDIRIGQKEAFTTKITKIDMDKFCQVTNDLNPLHRDKEYAVQQGFENCVVYGMLTASYLSTLAGVYLPGQKSLIQSIEINFVRPVFVGDVLKVMGEVVDKNELFKTVILKISILNSKQEKVLRGKMHVGVLE